MVRLRSGLILSLQMLVMMFFIADCVVRTGTQIVLVVLEVFVPQTTSIRVATLLDALSSVRDAGSWVSWVKDVALVSSGTVERLVSILCGAAGLSLQDLFRSIQQPAIAPQPTRLRLHQPVQHWWWLDRLQAGVDAAVVAAPFVAFTLRVRAAAWHLTCSLWQHLWWWWAPVILLMLCGLGVVLVLIVLVVESSFPDSSGITSCGQDQQGHQQHHRARHGLCPAPKLQTPSCLSSLSATEVFFLLLLLIPKFVL